MFRAIVLISCVVFMISCAANRGQVYGEAPTIKKATPILSLNTTPQDYAGSTVLVSGTVIDVCGHAGCWVEVQAEDKSTIICKSLDESVLFPPDVIGQKISVQGHLLYDENAPGNVQEHHEGDAEAHACPAPPVLLGIDGARVVYATR